eukprot:3403489-Rhodomonas_salina.1
MPLTRMQQSKSSSSRSLRHHDHEGCPIRVVSDLRCDAAHGFPAHGFPAHGFPAHGFPAELEHRRSNLNPFKLTPGRGEGCQCVLWEAASEPLEPEAASEMTDL